MNNQLLHRRDLIDSKVKEKTFQLKTLLLSFFLKNYKPQQHDLRNTPQTRHQRTKRC